MLVALPVLSFLCAALLAVFLTVLLRRPSPATAATALGAWLLLANLVHAVNALLSSAPVWCDIATKLLLAATAALPGACVCAARYLELLASNRKIYPNTYSKRLHTLGDVALCYVLPLLYMTLHFAVQDHRFDLVRDYGCAASIHKSTPAVLIMILPPLILCSIALVLCLCSVWHCTYLSSERFTSHLAARSSVSSARFVRRLAASTLLTVALLAATLLPLLGPRPQRYADFIANFNIILTVKDPREILAAEAVWWAVPVLTTIYLLLAFVLGDEASDALTWLKRRIARAPPPRPARPELSRLTFTHAMVSTSSLVVPQAVQLRSGWDDMLDVKRGRRGILPESANRKSVISSAGSSEDSQTVSPSLVDDDDAFTSSTLTYLASPVAQALGLPSPGASSPVFKFPPSPSPTSVKSPSPSPTRASPSPTRADPTTLSLPSTPRPTHAPALAPPRTSSMRPSPNQTSYPAPLKLKPPRPQQPIPEDTASTISSIWDSPWPLPPDSPLPRTRSARHAGPAYPMYSPMEPPTPPPFDGSSVPGRAAPHRTQSVPRKSALKKTVRRTWSREALARGYPVEDVIYMTRTVEERAS
ncbi:pheromone A receptor-domain-containing protein [Mycena rosella]|uniref:Pheromone A receptor-domain-containing protein n=1 Tax=Mycena rosella TaxID=1033263 RepID=A0AAD7GHH7_MYCRO|nr:pheromone A receptor-domain-containing protein [Mycena rosella]